MKEAANRSDLVAPNALSARAFEHMNDGPGVRIRDHSDELQFFTTEAAGLAGLILDRSNLLSPK
jgi:hypothetical protein